MKEDQKNASNAALTADFNLEDLPKDLDENVRQKFEALLQSKLEFEETSRQFGDLFEQTENERKDLEDKLGLMEIEKNAEISKLKAEIQELKADMADGVSPLDLNKDLKKKEGGDDDSINTEKFQTLQECYLDLENEYETYKKNSEFEIQNLNSRALTSEQRAQGFEEKIQELMEDNSQKTNKIEELTQQIIDFQNNQENDKTQSFQLIEGYMNEIKNLRDQKEEHEQKERAKFNNMQAELTKQVEEEKREKERALNEIEEFKKKAKNMDSEIKLKMKAFADSHQKEITFNLNDIDPDKLKKKSNIPRDYSITVYFESHCQCQNKKGELFFIGDQCQKFLNETGNYEEWENINNIIDNYYKPNRSKEELKLLLFGNHDYDDIDIILGPKDNKFNQKSLDKISEENEVDSIGDLKDGLHTGDGNIIKEIDEAQKEYEVSEDEFNDSFEGECNIF